MRLNLELPTICFNIVLRIEEKENEGYEEMVQKYCVLVLAEEQSLR